MLYDATVLISCNGKDCKDEIEVCLDRTIDGGWSGDIASDIEAEGWFIIDDDDIHYCPNCSPEPGE